MNWLQRAAAKTFGIKAAYPESGFYERNSWVVYDWDFLGLQTPTDQDFAKVLNIAHKSSLITSPLEYLVANATATPWQITDADGVTVDDHPLLRLLDEPTPLSDGTTLLSSWLWSLALDGNAYAHIVRRRDGEAAELQYLPHTAVSIKPDRTGIRHFSYRVNGRDERIPVEDMLHIRRYGDWQRAHYGRAIIASLGPEIWLDFEAKRVVASIMKNRGMPGGFIMPKDVATDAGMTSQSFSAEDLRATRDYMRNEFTGGNRGNWLAFGRSMEAVVLQYDPRMLDMSAAYHVAEERTAQAFGLPASEVGFDAGLRNTRVGSTAKEYRRVAWQTGIQPIQSLIAKAIQRKLAPEQGLTLSYDYSGVEVLQEDESERAERWARLYDVGIALRSDARVAFTLPVSPGGADDVYKGKVSDIEIPFGQTQEERDAAQAAANAEAIAAIDQEQTGEEDEQQP